MKNYKKILAGVLATSMVLGNSALVFADEGGSTKGSGKVEGQVKQEVFSVVLPTESSYAGVFDYTIDPMKLITSADSSKYDTSKYKFDTTVAGDTVFFYNGIIEDAADAAKKKLTYTGQSNKLEVENRSSVNVELTVSLRASGAEGIVLTSDKNFQDSSGSADSTDPSLYLEIKGEDYSMVESTGAHTAGGNTENEAVSSNGVAVFTADLKPMEAETAGDAAFVTQWNPLRNVYEYVENAAIDKKVYGFEFCVTGQCNPNAGVNWLDALEDCETPELEIVWSIADPTGADIDLDQSTKTIEMTGFTAEQTYKSITISDETGIYDLTGTLTAGADWDETTGEGSLTFTYDDGWVTWMKDKLVTITLNLTDGSSRTITVIGD